MLKGVSKMKADRTSYCNNRQCKNCKYSFIDETFNETFCGYILIEKQSRGCAIPFCKRFKPKDNSLRYKFTKDDFADWYEDFQTA